MSTMKTLQDAYDKNTGHVLTSALEMMRQYVKLRDRHPDILDTTEVRKADDMYENARRSLEIGAYTAALGAVEDAVDKFEMKVLAAKGRLLTQEEQKVVNALKIHYNNEEFCKRFGIRYHAAQGRRAESAQHRISDIAMGKRKILDENFQKMREDLEDEGWKYKNLDAKQKK